MTTAENAAAEPVSKVTQFWATLPSEDGVTAALWRITDRGQPEFLDTYFLTRQDYPDEYRFYAEVKAEHGGGKYELRVTTAAGQWVAKPTFCIGGKPKRQEEEPRQPGQVSELAMLMQRSDERFAQLLAEMREQRSQPAAPPVDPLEQIERVASILNRTGAAPAPQKGLVEQMMELKAAAELMGLGGDKGDEPEGFGWVRELVTQAAPLLIGAAKGQSGGDTAAPELPAAEVDEQAALMKRAQLLLRGMVQLAGHNVNPAAPHTVDTIREQAGSAWPLVLDILQRADAVQLAAGLVPEVAQHAEWFEGFRQAVIAPPVEEDKGTAAPGRRTKRARA